MTKFNDCIVFFICYFTSKGTQDLITVLISLSVLGNIARYMLIIINFFLGLLHDVDEINCFLVFFVSRGELSESFLPSPWF